MAPKKNLVSIAAKLPLAIVALGMVLTVVWMAALLWFFVAATGYAGGALLIG